MSQYKNIVWDWNGTLLDDKQTGLATLNRMLAKRKLKSLTMEEYRDIFGFPVEDFYRKVGFNLKQESLHEISVDFVATYDRVGVGVGLNEGVAEVLAELHRLGMKQYILSALREDLLSRMVEDFGIGVYFSQLCGSDNIYAAGKIERGRRMAEQYGICPGETLMIGDTVHDAEVAEALGFDKLLYTGGHNSEQRLQEKGRIVQKISEIPSLFK